VIDVAGIHQPRIEPEGLQQVEHRFPVIAGGFHNHPLDTDFDQVIGQLRQRPGHRRMRRHLLQPLVRITYRGDPDTTHQLGFADIQRSDPGNDVFLVLGFGQHRLLLLSITPDTERGRPWGSQRGKRNLVLVLGKTRRQQ